MLALPNEIRDLRRPPIVEAIVDIRFAIDTDVELSSLTASVDHFAALLPFFEKRRVALNDMSFDFVEETTPQVAKDDQVYELYRSDRPEIEATTRSIAIQKDGITVRHANPYGGWSSIYATMEELFGLYVSAVKPRAVIRMAARYINKIVLPSGLFDFDDYFKFGPQVPGEVSNQVFDFHSRIGVQAESSALKAWITQYLHHDTPSKLSVILDIDVFRSDWYAPSWQAIANPLEDIHMTKNRLFFGSLTGSALGAYE